MLKSVLLDKVVNIGNIKSDRNDRNPKGGEGMVRKRIIARGRVQGVGFRYICQSFATQCKVTGWIQNKFDGSVEMEVQGAEHRVALYIQKVEAGNRFARIRSLDIVDIPPLGALEEKSFRIRY